MISDIYYTVVEIAKLANRTKDPIIRRIHNLEIKPDKIKGNTWLFSEENKNRILLNKVYKKGYKLYPVYITKEVLIIPSKLNFLTLEQL
jgi:phage regulator Rha-like protein